jgi:TATA-box binding protein (TBP) (component of TFIID and TFIIIB)
MFEIQNCTVAFKFHLSFTKDQFLRIARNGVNMEYNPRRFHAIIIRMRDKQQHQQQQQQHRQKQRCVACLLFQSGRAVLTGVRHPERAEYEAERVRRSVTHALHEEMGVMHLRVVNIVGTHTLTHTIRLLGLTRTLDREMFHLIIYDPTMFPALRCKLQLDVNVTATILLYHSGKVIVTGLRDVAHLKQTFSTLLPFLDVSINNCNSDGLAYYYQQK